MARTAPGGARGRVSEGSEAAKPLTLNPGDPEQRGFKPVFAKSLPCGPCETSPASGHSHMDDHPKP